MSKNIDWDNLGFGYVETEYRYLTTYKDGKWDEGGLITDANVVLKHTTQKMVTSYASVQI